MARPPHSSPQSSPQPGPRGAERRQHARARADWPLSVRMGESRQEVRLRDLSAAGACFFHDQPIDEMTLVELSFDLPAAGGTTSVLARGAVVRCQRISPRVEHYEVAVFLHDIREEDRRALAAWVKQQGPRDESRASEFHA